MALRFRRDVQKSSYYVWFLGAEEAKGFRGAKVITSALPYLIDRSKFQEPLKVTLQVSHKGIKIIQGSSKHFIPHSAITCSIQIGDIAACVLLLFNPETKCPLHVHAYRCDSETTAKALHQQLEVLINRPENQKQFEELEARIGITRMITPPYVQPEEEQCFKFNRNLTLPKKAESSLESTSSTRDSECSSSLPVPALANRPNYKQKRNLFDSLAAELRAKLNGSGPPILLPPRDYDTVHRSKGNIFKNKFNGNEKITKNAKLSQRPENLFSEQIRSFENLKIKQSSSEEDLSPKETSNLNGLIKTTNVKNHKYLHLRVNPTRNNGNNHNEYVDFINHKEDKIRPSIVRPINLDIKLKNSLNNNDSSQLPDSFKKTKQLKYMMDPNDVSETILLKGKNYIINSNNDRCDIQKKFNLTDKQKQLQMYSKHRGHEKVQQNVYNMEQDKKNELKQYYVPTNLSKSRSRNLIKNDYYQYEQEEFVENPFRQSAENTNYMYRINDNRMPVIRRNSFENDNESKHREHTQQFVQNKPTNNSSNIEIEQSFRDRFQGAKEKFRLIERSLSVDINNISNKNKYFQQSPIKLQTRNVYNEMYHGKLNENEFGRQSNILKNSKSLLNLNKGYRHSYAENSPIGISRANEELNRTNNVKHFW